MSERKPDGGEELDLATVTRDDLLLDALGRGEEATDGDDLAAMLAAWHADVTVDEADADAGGTDDGVDRIRPAVATGTPSVPVRTPARPARSRPLGRRALRLAAAVIAALVLATGLGVGSRTSGPTSPLWSLTKVLYPERAEVRSVEYDIERARAALTAGRLDEARKLIEQAQRDLARVGDPDEVTRLRAEIDAVLRDLAAATPTPPPPTPAPTSAAPTAGGADATRGPAPRTNAPAPQPPAPGAPAPSPTSRTNPLSPLPELPVPLPGSPLLSPLPVLPLPTGGLLG